MSETARSILQAALCLSDADRMIVAGGLLETLPSGMGGHDDAEFTLS